MSSVAVHNDFSGTVGNIPTVTMDLTLVEHSKTARENNDSTINAELDEISEKAQEQLDNYLLFPYGWDGYHGERFEGELIKEMKGLLSVITYFFKKERLIPSEITPGPASDASVDLEICYDNKTLILTKYPFEKEITVYSEDDETSQEEVFFFEELDLETKLYWLVS